MQIHKLSMLLGLLGPLGGSACAEIPQSSQGGPNTLAGRASLVTGGYIRGCEDVILLPVTRRVDKRFTMFGDLRDDHFMDASSPFVPQSWMTKSSGSDMRSNAPETERFCSEISRQANIC